ncbi:MAG: endolytic transglycosylase MltG [Anaerovoracaceae bacterium]|jgi:UPF0755 protein
MSAGRRTKKKKHTARSVVLLIILLFVAFALGSYLNYSLSISTPLQPDKKIYRSIEIKSGDPTSTIAKKLKKAKIIRSARAFTIYARVHSLDSSFQAGTYALSPSQSITEIVDTIVNGKVNVVSVTIPEGFTEYEIADRLADMGVVNRDVFIKKLESKDYSDMYPFLKNAQKGAHRLEGYLFPSTYAIPENATADQIIESMLDKYDTVFTSQYKRRAKELGYTENQIIIIASIIEKEAASDQDRKKIASVIYNRLDAGMRLQMDSTVQYVLGLKKSRKKDLTISDTKLKSEYNTYKKKGLPYGPICCPGKKSIEAALYPAKTDYLYFILSDKLDGTMNFSKSYKKFLKDKKAYYDARDKAEKNSNGS